MHDHSRPTWLLLILVWIGWATTGVSNEAGAQPSSDLAERPLVMASEALLRAGTVHATLPGPLNGKSDQAVDLLPPRNLAPTRFATGSPPHPEAPLRFCCSILAGRSAPARAPPLEVG